jgi:hypothetical protein
VFAFGSDQLVSRIRYADQTPGTVLRWSWQRDGRPLDFPDADGPAQLPNRSGRVDAILIEPDGGPLRLGTYELRVFRGTMSEPVAMAAARIQRGGGTAATRPGVIEVLIDSADLDRMAAEAWPHSRSGEVEQPRLNVNRPSGRLPAMAYPR